MYETTSKLNGFSTSVKVFDSVSEIAETIRESAKARTALDTFARSSNSDFLGREIDSPETLLSEVDGTWNHGLLVIEDMLDKLADVELPQPVSRVRRTRFNADNGDEVCRDRLMSGQDFWRDSYRQPVYGNPVVTINAAVGCLAEVDADDVLWRGAAAIAMTKILESAGYSVELWATSHSDCATADADDWACFTAIKLKSAGDTLNESSLVNAVSAWFFRTMIFASRFLNVGNYVYGESVGRTISQNISEAFKTHISDDPNVLTIDDCFTLADAVKTARKHLQTICQRAEGMVA